MKTAVQYDESPIRPWDERIHDISRERMIRIGAIYDPDSSSQAAIEGRSPFIRQQISRKV